MACTEKKQTVVALTLFFIIYELVAEQMIWVCVYLFTLSAGYSSNALLYPSVFNWSAVGFAILVLVFVGSSTLSESISASKYPEYKKYQRQVFKYLPFKKCRLS